MMSGKSIPAVIGPDDARAVGVSIRSFHDVDAACDRFFLRKGMARPHGWRNGEGSDLARREMLREDAKKRAAEMAREDRISRGKERQ
jgi:hypothetical protein